MSKKRNNKSYNKDFTFENNEKIYIYLDSTLPFTVLKNIPYKKNFILLARKKHLIEVVNKFYIKDNKAINVSFFYALRLLYILIKIRVFNNKIIFFHECCNPLFDILVNLLRIKGLYIPIAKPLKWYKNYNFAPYKIKSLPINKKILYFIFNFFLKNFSFYIRGNLKKKPFIYFVLKKYHSCVKIDKTIKINNDIKRKNPKKKILLFLSKTPPYNNEDYNEKVIQSYDKIINYCKKNKIKVYIKNHPQKTSRLNLLNRNVLNISPEKPAELIEYNEYDLFISLSSLSLYSFNDKAISIVALVTNKLSVIRHYKKVYLYANVKRMSFPKTYNALFKIIKKRSLDL